VSKYLKLLALFLILQLFFVFAASAISGAPNHYIAAIIDKEADLARAASPRLILVGGSNLAFGVDSAALQAGLGNRFHVVNAGLHAGLGLDFMLNQALAHVRPGDVVVVSPEYTLLWSDASQAVELVEAAYFLPQSARHVPRAKRVSVFASGLVAAPAPILHEVAVSAARRAVPALGRGGRVYYRDSFNEWGDNTAARSLPSEIEEPRGVAPESFRQSQLDVSVSKIEDFATQAHRRGARVAFAFPPVTSYYFEWNSEAILTTAAALESTSGITVLGTPAQETYSVTDFYDSPDHLRGHAVQLRTQHLGEDLRRWLNP